MIAAFAVCRRRCFRDAMFSAPLSPDFGRQPLICHFAFASFAMPPSMPLTISRRHFRFDTPLRHAEAAISPIYAISLMPY
jgi:hypothetical protein